MLKFNEKKNEFVLFTTDDARAEAAGLTLSTTIRGPKGERVYYTADHSKNPEYNPYAVLEFYEEADDQTKKLLYSIHKDYQSSWADDHSIDVPVPDRINPSTGEPFAYMPYQKAGIAYALARTHCVIGDEPGLGKTIQAVGIANATDARKILVLCPASIRRNWKREIVDWSTLRRPLVQTVEKGSDGINPHMNYTVCSYDLARREGIHNALAAQEWDLLVCDEGHYLKTSEAQRTRAVFGGGEKTDFFYRNGLDEHAKRIVAMTGTPLPNRPREAYTLARGLDWESIDYLSYEPFMYRYNASIEQEGNKWEVKGRLPELNARMRSNFMVRRLKKDVLPQLPDKRYEMTYIEPNGAISNILAKEALIDFDPRDLFNSDFTMDGTPISTLRREMGEAMVPRIADYMRYLLDIVEVPKAMLLCHHTSVILELAQILERYGIAIHKGGMGDAAKEEAKADFIAGRHRIFLGQLDTMEGIDGLQSICSNVVFGEPAWTPGRNEQCVDRAHRIGQHGNVLAHFLLVEGSFNEKVLNVVLDKAGDIHESLDRRLV